MLSVGLRSSICIQARTLEASLGWNRRMDLGPRPLLKGLPACQGLQNQQVCSLLELAVQWVQGHYHVVSNCFEKPMVAWDGVIVWVQVFASGVRGHPISHFHCSRFHPTPRLELRPTPLFELELRSAPISGLHSALKSELHSTFTSGVTADVK